MNRCIAGSGTYSCTKCHTKVSLGSGDKMPPCPSCSNDSFECMDK